MSIRLRYLLVFALLIIAFAGFSYRQVRGDLEVRYREAVEENMVDQVQLLSSLLSTSLDTHELKAGMAELAQRKFSATIYEFEKKQSHSFTYITNDKGMVIFHSADPSQIGQDYSAWRDVHLTLKGKYGARSTRIDSLDDNSSVLYVAAPIIQNSKIVGVVTLGKPVQDFLVFLDRARGRMFWWLASGCAILILLGVIAGYWVTQPLRRIEADLSAKRYIEEYVQNLTHELKSPISAILGATEILEEKPEPKVQAHFLANIKSESLRMRDLVSMILQVAALERKRETIKEEIDVQDLIGNLRSSLEVPMHTKAIQIQWPTIHAKLNGDLFLLTQGIHNLLLNAIEYSPLGAVLEFDLSVEGEKLLGSIRDYGPGIPDYALPRLFEKFYSLPKPATGRKGTGLGLAFAREVFRLHNGQVNLKNAPQAGAIATFSVRI